MITMGLHSNQGVSLLLNNEEHDSEVFLLDFSEYSGVTQLVEKLIQLKYFILPELQIQYR